MLSIYKRIKQFVKETNTTINAELREQRETTSVESKYESIQHAYKFAIFHRKRPTAD